ncbi:MAG: hypothetical protein Q9218_002246 [Villophora microphyllina]
MSIAYFASPFTESDGRVLDGRLHKLTGKRKRATNAFENSSLDPSDSLDAVSPATVFLGRDSNEQYRTAGQSSGSPLHPYPFPHAPPKAHTAAKSNTRSSKFISDPTSADLSTEPSESDNDELQTVAASRSSTKTGLRQQHYTVLTSLLHRCLLERDYARASRAWGMLLRLETHGHPLDIRTHDRWGVGAELLLHGKGAHDGQLTLKNLDIAKDYYERLILQYPYRKTAPDATSSLKFYPVMFGIWIYSIQLRYKLATQTAPSSSINRHSTGSPGDNDSDSETSRSGTTTSESDEKSWARQTTFQQAREVVERLNELLISPPFSDHSGLWRIQGMLFMWISQLLSHGQISSQPSGSSDEEPSSATHDSDSNVEHTKPVKDKADLQGRQSECQEARVKAREAFSRALALGCSVDSQIMQELDI